MIAFVSGTCQKQLNDSQYIIQVGGVGYGVRSHNLLRIGQPVELFIYEHIREDAFDLYGFKTQEELLVFKQIIGVSGVGPKIGLLVLKQGSTSDLQKAVEENNVAYFESISGIGKKMAQKLIIELRSKIGQESDLASLDSDSFKDLKEALLALGYKQHEFIPILKSMPHDLKNVQEQLPWMLRNLGKYK